MNLEQLSYLADIIGVIAIVASLIYVARQINQNTLTLQTNAGTAFEQWGDSMLHRVSSDREFAEVWAKGNSQFKDLDSVDQLRLLWFETNGILRFATYFDQHERGLLPETSWQRVIWSLENLGQRESMHEAWKSLKGSLDPRFSEMLDGYLDGG